MIKYNKPNQTLNIICGISMWNLDFKKLYMQRMRTM